MAGSRGLTKLAQGEHGAAEKDFTKAIELAGENEQGLRARALYYRGQARKEQGETEQGDADQAEAKKLFPQVARRPALPNQTPPPKKE